MDIEKIKTDRQKMGLIAARFCAKAYDGDMETLVVITTAYQQIINNDESGYNAIATILQGTKEFIEELLEETTNNAES